MAELPMTWNAVKWSTNKSGQTEVSPKLVEKQLKKPHENGKKKKGYS